jgi:WD40 repeat protein
MVVSSLVELPVEKFISGRSLLLATSFIDTSQPAQYHIASPPSGELLLSPSGESIIVCIDNTTRLWRTTDPTTSLSAVPTQPADQNRFAARFWDNVATRLWRTTDPTTPSMVPTRRADQNTFILEFSPDESLAAVARFWDNMATIIDLKSGDPRLIIDTGMEIYGMGVTGNAVIVVGKNTIITWDVPAGDCVLGARANIRDSARTIVLNHPAPPPASLGRASISPDFDYIAVRWKGHRGLEIYEISTGKHLVGATATGIVYPSSERIHTPWFTRDGCEVWSSWTLPRDGWKIIKGGGSDVIELESLRTDPSEGCPWDSHHGRYNLYDDWIWGEKRWMWLPYSWRMMAHKWPSHRWAGRFWGLLDGELPEPVILELGE